MKLIAALSKAFRKEGQSLSEFAAEVKALTPKDKADFVGYFEAEGVTIDDADTYRV